MTTATQTTLPEPLAGLLVRLGALLHDDGFGTALAAGNAPYAIFERGNLISLLEAPDDEPEPASRHLDLQEHPDHPGHDRLVQTWAVGPRGYLLLIRAAEARARGASANTGAAAGQDGKDADVRVEDPVAPAADAGQDRWVDEEEICARLQVSISHLRRLLSRAPADLPGAPVSIPGRGGGQRLVRRWREADVPRWLEAVTAWERRGPGRPSTPRRKKPKAAAPTKGVVDWNEPVATLLK